VRLTLAWMLVCAALVALPATASANELLSDSLVVPNAVARTCTERPLDGAAGTAQRTVTVPASGWVTARLDGAGPGDWDLGVFDAESGRAIAGSASFGLHEVAQGFATAGERVVVQVCRREGNGDGAQLAVASVAVPSDSGSTAPPQLVNVVTPTPERKAQLLSLGLDLSESGGTDSLGVVLHGDADAQKLRDHGFSYTVAVSDLAARDRRDRAADAVNTADMPSGRTTYRHLADYENDMKRLAAENPDLVGPIVLPFKTWTGREVDGIEITHDPSARDGKPVFLLMGIHHAREWPAGENTMEFAFDLVNGYRAGDARTRGLVDATRTIVIPIVNPDGFNTSREAPSAMDDGREPDPPTLGLPYEYQRKNCRTLDDSEAGSCTQMPNSGTAQFGVDPNRNYGGFWGGPGASTDHTAQDYRGPGPFSEPETRNIRDLVSHRQVTTLITNHTFGDLLLRPPGIASQGPPPDEGVYKALGDAMAQSNGYSSQRSYQLYDTTGATEDWTYYATGGLGFTFEMGCDVAASDGSCTVGNFHPSYAKTAAEYLGTTARAAGGGGNRAAFFKALENTADPARHSVIEGTAPAGSILRLHKEFDTQTSPVLDAQGMAGPVQQFHDVLDTTMQVPSSGRFQWDVNPSTRPVVAQSSGRVATGPPSSPITFATNAGGTTTPCPGPQTPACRDDRLVVAPADTAFDNERMIVRATWGSPLNDWDMEVYRDDDGSGTVSPGDPLMGTSAQGGTTFEQVAVAQPALRRGATYIVRMVNFSSTEPYNGTASFKGPDPFVPAQTEAWSLTCESPEGTVRSTQSVVVGRGERTSVSACGSAAASGPAPETPIPAPGPAASRCVAVDAGISGRSVGPARLGRTREQQRAALGGEPTAGRGADRYCVDGGGALRIGYAPNSLALAAARRPRGRLQGRTVLILTTSKRARVRGLSAGSRTSRRVLRRARRVRAGREDWYLLAGRGARQVVRVRRSRVIEVGIADTRLTKGRAAARFVRTFRR
jgi:hypothetical protein